MKLSSGERKLLFHPSTVMINVVAGASERTTKGRAEKWKQKQEKGKTFSYVKGARRDETFFLFLRLSPNIPGKKSTASCGERRIVSIFMWKLLQQPVAVYWLNEFNLLQFLFSFFPITFETDFFFPATVVAAVARAINTFFSVSFAKCRLCVCALVQPPMRWFKHFYGQFELSSSLWQQFTSNSNWSFGFWWFADETTRKRSS